MLHRGTAAFILLVASCAWAAEERPYDADAHTVLLLHFDDAGDERTPDASPSGLDATLLPPPRRPTWEASGMFGGCLRFDGVSADEDGDGSGDADGLVIRDNGELRPGEGLTVEAWVRPDGVDRNQAILTRSGAARYCLYLYGSALYFPMLTTRDGKADWVQLKVPGVIEAGRWQHVAVTYDGEMLRAYVDGVQVGESAVDGVLTTGPAVTIIGCDTDSRPLDYAIRGFKGLIDEVRVSNVTRSEFNVSEDRMAAQQERLAQGAEAPELPDRPRYPDPPLPPLNARHVVVTGRVTDDGGRPLPGVPVSDGEHVVRTDDAGGYRLEFDLQDLRLVFVTEPRGYRPEGPWFARIPRDDARTEYACDFAFAADPLADRERFTFLATGDTQFNDLATFAQLREEYDQFTRMSGDPAFVTVAGDLTMTGSQWEMDLYKEVCECSHLPVYNCFGGHDGNYAREREGSGSIYHYQKNLAPAWYSWDCGPVHFTTYVSETYFLTERQQQLQAAWLAADLAAQPEGTPIVLVTHIPPDNEVMQGWLDRHNIIGLIFGHWHQVQSCGFGGVPYLETGPMRGRDWGAFTRKFRVITYAEGELSSEVRVCGQVRRLEVIAPQGSVGRDTLPVEVKAYDTTRRVTGVTCRIEAGGDAVNVPLTQVGAWTWRGNWDAAQSPAGEVSVHVTAEDEAGERWEATAGAELGAAPLPPVRVAEDWPGFFRADHSRVRDETLAPPLALAWSVNTGGRNMKAVSPIVYRGRVYVGVENKEIGHPGAGLRCYDPASGEPLWSAATGASVTHAPAAHEGLIYAVDSMGVCHAFDADSGARQWRQDVFPSGNGRRNICSCPVVHGDELIALSDSGECAVLDAATGDLLRRLEVASGWMYCTFPSVQDGRLFLGFRRSAVAADLLTGEQIWSAEIATGKAASCPVAHGGALYINAVTLSCLDRQTGDERWRRPVPTSGNGISVAVPAGDLVLANGSSLCAFDAGTGELRWRHEFAYDARTAERNQRQAYAGQSTPLVSGDVVYAGSDDGYLYAFALDDGEPLWRYNLGVPLKGSPVTSGNALFICDWDGNLYCFAAQP